MSSSYEELQFFDWENMFRVLSDFCAPGCGYLQDPKDAQWKQQLA